jgi:hypothetical protein
MHPFREVEAAMSCDFSFVKAKVFEPERIDATNQLPILIITCLKVTEEEARSWFPQLGYRE